MTLCFICYNSVSYATNEIIREKYKDVVGFDLCSSSHLCYICTHEVQKLWRFKSICVKKSLEYPVLFDEKGLIKFQRNEITLCVICPEDANCDNTHYDTNNAKLYQYISHSDTESIDNEELNNPNDIQENDELIRQGDDAQNYDDDYNEYPTDEIDTVESTQCKTQERENQIVIDENTDNIADLDVKEDKAIDNTINNYNETPVEKVKKKKHRKKDRKGFKKVVLTVDEQKSFLDSRRKEKKYLEAEFKCYNCAMGFLFKHSYQAHMMRHEESNGEFQCPICTLRFASSSVLRAHKATHSHRYTCTVCKQPVRGKVRKIHADKCHRGINVSANCHLCGGVFKSVSHLQQHVRRRHAPRRVPYHDHAAHTLKHLKRSFACDLCPSVYNNPYTLTQHKKTKHNNKNDDIELFYCEMCQVSFSNKKGLLAHKRNTVKHQQTYVECEICYRVLTTRRALLRHIQSVHCLNKPVRNKNINIQVAVCHVCGQSFKGTSKLNRHLKRVCEKEKPQELTQENCEPDYSYSCYYQQNQFQQ